jgi:uncharacterized protein YecE (DUF72 family)
MSKYKIGTAGWFYKDWLNVFYPTDKGKEKTDWLEFYSKHFNVVEVNSTYYTYPSITLVNGWLKKVENEEDFSFVIKIHQDFTHKRNFTEENVNTFHSSLNLLQKENRLSGLLIQFPYSFQFSNNALIYLSKLKEIFDSANLFFELRHSSWLNKNAIDFFTEKQLTFCTIDQPQLGSTLPFKPIITNEIAYIRFHGRNKEAWSNSIKNFGKKQTYEEQSERYKYLYSNTEILEVVFQLKEIENKVKEIYLIMNNHPTGYAVVNAFEFIHHLKEEMKSKPPETLVKAFPTLELVVSSMRN